jgi:metal-responsive CopG/Arc/MetJ family transcriptional regulator
MPSLRDWLDVNLELDDGLADRLEQRAEANGFDSASEYTTTLLRTVLDELDRVENDSDVEERLEDLGYL